MILLLFAAKGFLIGSRLQAEWKKHQRKSVMAMTKLKLTITTHFSRCTQCAAKIVQSLTFLPPFHWSQLKTSSSLVISVRFILLKQLYTWLCSLPLYSNTFNPRGGLTTPYRLERCIGIIASLVRLLTTIGKHRWRLFFIWKPSQNNRSQWLSRNNRTDCDCDIEKHRSLTMVVICWPLLLPKADVKQSNQRFWQI